MKDYSAQSTDIFDLVFAHMAAQNESFSAPNVTYSVWLLTRPLSYTIFFPPFGATSDGKHHLCHWGILVNEMSQVDAQAIWQRTRNYGASDKTELGTMYELFRDENDRNNVHITTPFQMANMKKEWPMFSMQYVGQTLMSYERIKQEGKSPTNGKILYTYDLLANGQLLK
jgi:hypothetical protein